MAEKAPCPSDVHIAAQYAAHVSTPARGGVHYATISIKLRLTWKQDQF